MTTAKPRRIQRRRTKGWTLPDNAVIVSRPSRFGNPFTIKDAIEAEYSEPHRACADNYGEWLRVGTEGGWYSETYRIGRQTFDRNRVLAELHLLRGKDLACTCPLPQPGQPDHCHAAVLLKLANKAAARTHTPDRVTTNEHGHKSTTFTVQRACNGCGTFLGDVTDAEMDRATHGLPPEDVRAECDHCRPLVELEAAGCKSWQLTERSYERVAHEIDQLRPWVFTKGYWQTVDGKLQVVGLRIGEYPGHVVARFGDWIIRHPDGGFTVHKAPASKAG